MTAPLVFGRLHLLPVATAFLETYPEVDMRLVLSDRNLDLINEHLDAALRIGALPDSSLTAVHVGDVRRIAVASPDLLRRYGTPRVPTDLVTLPCIAFEGIAADRSWVFSGPGGDATSADRVPIRPHLTVNTDEAAVDAAAAGVGVARAFTYQCAAGLTEGTLVRVLCDFEPKPVPVHLLYVGKAPLPLKLRTFLDHAGPRLRQRLAKVPS